MPQHISCPTCSTLGRAAVVPVCYSGKRNRRKTAKVPGMFEVKVVTPPPRSLGVHPLHPHTTNGDLLQVDEVDYVVSSVVLNYKLVGGRYQRENNRLEVQTTGRYFLNMHLQQLLDAPS